MLIYIKQYPFLRSAPRAYIRPVYAHPFLVKLGRDIR